MSLTTFLNGWSKHRARPLIDESYRLVITATAGDRPRTLQTIGSNAWGPSADPAATS